MLKAEYKNTFITINNHVANTCLGFSSNQKQKQSQCSVSTRLMTVSSELLPSCKFLKWSEGPSRFVFGFLLPFYSFPVQFLYLTIVRGMFFIQA